MERLSRKVIQEVKRVGEIFDIGQVSFQLEELLTLISEGKEIDIDKFKQISPEALSFLQEKAQFLEENELRYVLLALLTEPKPENQGNIIKIIEEFLGESKEKTEERISREKIEAKKFSYFNAALEGVRKKDLWDNLLSFYSNPKNQEIRPEILKEVLEYARREGRWGFLISFYSNSNPENQKIKPEILEEVLEGARRVGRWDFLLYFYSNPENQKIKPEILEEALEGARREIRWLSLLYFYSNPENQKIKPELLDEVLEFARRRSWWYDLIYFNPLLNNFYSNPENQKIKPEILDEVLELTKKEGLWGSLLDFYFKPENQYRRDELLEETLEGAKKEGLWEDLLNFYSNPENQKIKPEILEEALEGAKKEGLWEDLLNFYSNPENQKIKPEILEEALEGARRVGRWLSLLNFYSNPENQKIKPEILEEALEGARKEGWWDFLISFYSKPENQPKLSLTTQDKIIKSIKNIADENLRTDVLGAYSKYFKENNSLFLFLLSKNEDLPILITAYNLNIQPEVILSWNLTQEEKETILPILVDLNKHNIRFPFPFIFYPRKEEKEKKKIKSTRKIIDYLRTLNFIANLPKKIKYNLIKNHFKKIEDLVQKYGITQTTENIFYFVKETLPHIRELKKEAFRRLKQVLQIQEEITEEGWEKFIKEAKYLNQLITLAIHYSQTYQEGLPLLGKIATAMIKGTYFDLRYNLEDPLTQEQLAPLLEDIKDEQRRQKILDIWRGNYFSFHLQSVEEVKRETESAIDYTHILEHLRSQIIGDKHYKVILNLITGLNEEDRQILSSVFEEALNGKTINFENIKQILGKYQLSEEKISCFIGIIQLLRDLNFKKKIEDYLSTIERLKENIKNHWPELLNTEIVQIDIFNYLQGQLNQLKSPSEKLTRKRILVSYFTDHPKTLLEIGAYPVATCQDYRSKGTYNRQLLGYIFDAHIKALVAREIEIEEDIEVEDLKQAQIEIDDNNERISIILKDGKRIEASVSKPIARRIVMLGKLDDQSTLLLEPVYSRVGRTSGEIEYLNKPINKLLEALRSEGISIGTTTSDLTITPESHNPDGYYRDI
jgi:hypothetical protein